jgi:hypothetical protein
VQCDPNHPHRRRHLLRSSPACCRRTHGQLLRGAGRRHAEVDSSQVHVLFLQRLSLSASVDVAVIVTTVAVPVSKWQHHFTRHHMHALVYLGMRQLVSNSNNGCGTRSAERRTAAVSNGNSSQAMKRTLNVVLLLLTRCGEYNDIRSPPAQPTTTVREHSELPPACRLYSYWRHEACSCGG